MLQNLEGDWDNLKAELKLHFAEVIDSQQGKQNKIMGNYYNFAVRLLALAEDAFPGFIGQTSQNGHGHQGNPTVYWVSIDG